MDEKTFNEKFNKYFDEASKKVTKRVLKSSQQSIKDYQSKLSESVKKSGFNEQQLNFLMDELDLNSELLRKRATANMEIIREVFKSFIINDLKD